MAESAAPIRGVAAPGVIHNQVDVDVSSTLIVAARAGRRTVIVINHSAIDVFLGSQGVTTLTGLLLTGIKGTGINIPTDGDIYGIAASGSARVSYMELFGK